MNKNATVLPRRARAQLPATITISPSTSFFGKNLGERGWGIIYRGILSMGGGNQSEKNAYALQQHCCDLQHLQTQCNSDLLWMELKFHKVMVHFILFLSRFHGAFQYKHRTREMCGITKSFPSTKTAIKKDN